MLRRALPAIPRVFRADLSATACAPTTPTSRHRIGAPAPGGGCFAGRRRQQSCRPIFPISAFLSTGRLRSTSCCCRSAARTKPGRTMPGRRIRSTARGYRPRGVIAQVNPELAGDPRVPGDRAASIDMRCRPPHRRSNCRAGRRGASTAPSPTTLPRLILDRATIELGRGRFPSRTNALDASKVSASIRGDRDVIADLMEAARRQPQQGDDPAVHRATMLNGNVALYRFRRPQPGDPIRATS